MMATASAFVYQFTAKEFSYLLFKKKICPRCGGKMRKQKCSEIVDRARFDSASAPLYTKRPDVKHHYYTFTCELADGRIILENKFTGLRIVYDDRSRTYKALE